MSKSLLNKKSQVKNSTCSSALFLWSYGLSWQTFIKTMWLTDLKAKHRMCDAYGLRQSLHVHFVLRTVPALYMERDHFSVLASFLQWGQTSECSSIPLLHSFDRTNCTFNWTQLATEDNIIVLNLASKKPRVWKSSQSPRGPLQFSMGTLGITVTCSSSRAVSSITSLAVRSISIVHTAQTVYSRFLTCRNICCGICKCNTQGIIS